MPPRQRPNATRATTGVSNQTTASPGCSIATQTQPHTATADTSHIYVTHLIEDGLDARFVQEHAGHDHSSTTSLYTCVSSDYRTRTLRRVLDATVEAALNPRRCR
jgi:site-specific recombinase XerD